jgi:hypothetical protein
MVIHAVDRCSQLPGNYFEEQGYTVDEEAETATKDDITYQWLSCEVEGVDCGDIYFYYLEPIDF